MVSQSVLVETVAFLMQFSPAGSLQHQSNKSYMMWQNMTRWNIFSTTTFFFFSSAQYSVKKQAYILYSRDSALHGGILQNLAQEMLQANLLGC